MRTFSVNKLGLSALLATAALFSTGSTLALAQKMSAPPIKGVTHTTQPEAKAIMETPAPVLSDAQREDLVNRLQALRERTSSKGGDPARGLSNAPETHEAAESEANRITRNRQNSRSRVVSSTLAEPAAANDSSEVLYLGNTYFSRSTNNGTTWLADVLPAGPAEAPIACCDPDAVHHGPRDTTFAIMLYVNNALTNGVIRIFVRRGTIAGGNDCTYLIDPGGAANNVLPDYPHIAVSNNFFYLTTNNIRNNAWIGSQVHRIPLSQIANCQAIQRRVFTYTGPDGQRILTPVENSSTTQYFGLNRTSTRFRIIRLREAGNALEIFDRTLPHGSNFVNPDCRGGTGNFDFIERSTSWSIAGFRLRGAVVPGSRLWFVWNVARDASHAQAHIQSAIFSEPGLGLLPSPSIFNNSRCFGYPVLGANRFGEFGMSFAHGGRQGGGGQAAQGAIAVDDANSAGNTFPFFVTTATGTHNRSDGRFGDYFTVRRNDKCSHGWVGTNYALSGGNTTSAHVNARYIEFQSSLRANCP
jgi:hypothetical protein